MSTGQDEVSPNGALQQAPELAATYFDGRSARARDVTLKLQGDALLVTGDDVHRSIALKDVQWPERTRHGVRSAHFTGGGSVQGSDADAWDAWFRISGMGDSFVVTLQQSWRWVAASTVLLVALLVGLQQWGLPVAARAVVSVAPLGVDKALGEATLEAVDNSLMKPSRLPQAEQDRLRAAFAQAVASLPAESVPAWKLEFRRSRIGPNAFALPGGTMVMTDELVEMVGRDEQVVVAVLAHELGHVRHRHGLRMLVQTLALSGLASMVVGDFSTVLAAAPVLLGQASYSRQAEREADVEAVQVLRAARISPAVMVKLFDGLAAWRAARDRGEAKPGDGRDTSDKTAGSKDATRGGADSPDKNEEGGSWLGIAFASHPADADRVRFFTEAAAGR